MKSGYFCYNNKVYFAQQPPSPPLPTWAFLKLPPFSLSKFNHIYIILKRIFHIYSIFYLIKLFLCVKRALVCTFEPHSSTLARPPLSTNFRRRNLVDCQAQGKTWGLEWPGIQIEESKLASRWSLKYLDKFHQSAKFTDKIFFRKSSRNFNLNLCIFWISGCLLWVFSCLEVYIWVEYFGFIACCGRGHGILFRDRNFDEVGAAFK